MRVRTLGKDVLGKRVRVSYVAPSELGSKLGDTPRLIGQEGVAQHLLSEGGEYASLIVLWDSSEAGSLMLASEDEVEVLG